VPYVQTNFVLGLDGDEGPEPFALTKRFVDLTPGAFPGYSRFCRKFSFEVISGMISPHDSWRQERGRETMAVSFKGAHFPQEIILPCIRWYVAYPLSTRHVEELMLERGVHVDHATINRWVVKYGPQLEAAFHRRKRPVWVSWRMDETYIKVKGEWC
jgi:hypothetical protein